MSKKPQTNRKYSLRLIIGYFVMPFFFALLSAVKILNQFSLILPLILLAIFCIYWFLPIKRPSLTVLLSTLLVISLISATGWFFSPFFFALYLIAIGLGFIYTPGIAISFTLSLILLFTFSMTGERPTYDFLTLLSLLSVIPITIVLRKSFLLVQQEKKGILILEKEKNELGITSLDNILSNRINNIGATLRQPITYMKQAVSLLVSGKLSQEEVDEIMPRMQKSTEELFTLVKEFERETTNNKFFAQANKEITKKS